jgi:histidine decarboxylase
MTKTKYRLKPPPVPEYLGTPDTTLSGSRNAHSAVAIWDQLARHSYDDQIQRAAQALSTAAYAQTRLDGLTHSIGLDLGVQRSPWALAVRFHRPNRHLIAKHSLSTATLLINGEVIPYAHLYAMPGITHEHIDHLITDLTHARIP